MAGPLAGILWGVAGPLPDLADPRLTRQDIVLARELGVGAWLFPVAWGDLQPEGRGRMDAAAEGRYDRLVDLMAEAGLDPWPCLAGGGLPAPLAAGGGWTARDVARRFADHAAAVALRLGDRTRTFLLMDDPAGTAFRKDGEAAVLAALHHQNLATALAADALRSESGRWRIGTSLALSPVLPADDTQGAADAALLVDALWNGAVIDPLVHGRYPEVIAERFAGIAAEGDGERIHRPLDLIGLAWTGPRFARIERGGIADTAFDLAGPDPGALDGAGREIAPAGLTETLGRLKDAYGKPATAVTALGAPFPDTPGPDGPLPDRARIDHLEAHLGAAADARAAGADLAAIFLSLLDGGEGATGLVAVDPVSRERRPRASCAWFGRIAREGLG
jgi:beta-glucosidase